MEKEGLVFIRNVTEGILIAGVILAGLILLILISTTGEESSPQQKAAGKFARKEKQLQEKEDKLKYIEKRLKEV
jgi:hypothetical protein